MHLILIILEVIGGLLGLAVVLLVLFCLLLTKDGSNPFQ